MGIKQLLETVITLQKNQSLSNNQKKLYEKKSLYTIGCNGSVRGIA